MSEDSFIKIPTKRQLIIPVAITVPMVMGVVERGIKLYDYIKGLEIRVQKLERYKCVQGWNPPVTKDSSRICKSEEER